jgi:4-hydroxy-3-methylbut-2-enyl diphosphate reductase
MGIGTMRIVLANPRGFCAGVDRAIKVVDEVLYALGAPVYVRHEIVHNRHVVADFRGRGVIFVQELSVVPDGATVVFSAHGVSRQILAEGAARRLRVFDATCPLVTKVHLEVERHARAGRSVLVVGHRGHAEVLGTVGHYSNPDGDGVSVIQTEAEAEAIQVPRPEHIAYVTQTTLSVDDTSRIIATLTRRFPKIRGPHRDDICYATQSRQDAARALARCCDVALIIGARHSSNTMRLYELLLRERVESHLIESAEEVERRWLDARTSIGVTSGASAPEFLIGQLVERIRSWYHVTEVEDIGEPERVVFRLPRDVENLARPHRA